MLLDVESLHAREINPALPISNEAPSHKAGHQAPGEKRAHALPRVGAEFLAQKEPQSFWGERKPDIIAWWFGVSEERGLLGLSHCADP